MGTTYLKVDLSCSRLLRELALGTGPGALTGLGTSAGCETRRVSRFSFTLINCIHCMVADKHFISFRKTSLDYQVLTMFSFLLVCYLVLLSNIGYLSTK